MRPSHGALAQTGIKEPAFLHYFMSLFEEADIKVGGETGLRQNSPLLKKDGSWRKIGQTKTVNLLLRLETKEKLVLRFMTHQQARFDNNQSERDLRMNKVRQKVSGGFRSFRAGQECMQIRS